MNLASVHVTPKPENAEKSAAQRLVGALWYDMLSEMEKTAGGYQSSDMGNFQDLMNWQVSEHDFSSYDKSLVDAIMASIDGKHTVGGTSSVRIIDQHPLTEDLVANAALATPGAGLADVPDMTRTDGALDQWTNLASAIWPVVRKISADLNVPAIGVLSQVALETGWGAATPGNNLFGIKAINGEPGQNLETREFINGVDINEVANFRSYSTLTTALGDYERLIKTRYNDATNSQTVAEFAEALQSGGYATDANYAQKIIEISKSDKMKQMMSEISGSTNR
ncbi:glycoside hydrolase family 73 protein [Acidocella sp.]|uniref:glycoside hydrolase family 73 protein n=1 Tax=Acidocella sp. TaxID=50710 RepID=UPI0026200A4A|nr:glucosaminidase domain-containing protein [Acidocella sp.]